VNEGEIAGLVAGGYLPEEARSDPATIKSAIEGVISDLAREVQRKRISLLRWSEERVTERRAK